MIHNCTGGRWGVVIRRLLEAATRTLPLMLLLFLPITFGLRNLYIWALKGGASMVPTGAAYLNPEFFLLRAWLLLCGVDRTGLSPQSLVRAACADGAPAAASRPQALSGPGLVLYGLTVTFASIDWLMSLGPLVLDDLRSADRHGTNAAGSGFGHFGRHLSWRSATIVDGRGRQRLE